MRVAVLVGLLAVAAALALAFGPEPGATDEGAPANITQMRLGAVVAAAPEACSLCHYGWDMAFDFNGTRDGDRYRFDLRPVADYELVDVRAVPVYGASDQATRYRIPHMEGEVLLGQSDTHHIEVTEEAAALRVTLVGKREYGRPDLDLALVTPDGRRLQNPDPGNVEIVVATPVPPGVYTIEVTYRDGREPREAYTVEYDLATGSPSVVERAQMGSPASFAFNLTDPPLGFVVQFRTWNPHPSEAWTLPNWGDLGLYNVWVDARNPWSPPAPLNLTQAEIDALWEGEARQEIYRVEIDGTFARHRDARGEWTSRSVWRTPPGPEEPFPAVPPGTRELEVRITAESANPLTPPGDWYLAFTRPHRPTFFFPQPDAVEEDGTRVYRIPVPPDEWEPGEQGAWQWFARLRFDERGNALHDGPVRLTVEALR